LAKSVGLVIVDEAHQAIAPTYREVIETLSETGAENALVGLTATPGRTWSDVAADERLSEFFGGRKVTLEVEGWDDPVSFLMAEGYLARPVFRRLEVQASAELKPRLLSGGAGDDYDPMLLESLAEEVGRNVVIIEEARRLANAGHKRIILFGASVRHAELLAAALSALGFDARVVTGKTGATSRERTIKAFRQASPVPMILCNFGVLTTGFDAPNTSAAIIARPTKSLVLFSQMVGRATRGLKAGGNETCEISTVVDIDLPGFGDIADAFTNWEDVWNGLR
jgi:superfamily II DNA or RNA helicase